MDNRNLLGEMVSRALLPLSPALVPIYPEPFESLFLPPGKHTITSRPSRNFLMVYSLRPTPRLASSSHLRTPRNRIIERLAFGGTGRWKCMTLVSRMNWEVVPIEILIKLESILVEKQATQPWRKDTFKRAGCTAEIMIYCSIEWLQIFTCAMVF